MSDDATAPESEAIPTTEQLEAEAVAFAREWKAKAAPADAQAEAEKAPVAAAVPAEAEAEAPAKPDPLEEVERRAKARQAERENARAKAAQSQAEHDTAIAAARNEGQATASADLASRLRGDMIGTFEALGISAREAFGILREQAAHPETRRPADERKIPTAEEIAEQVRRGQQTEAQRQADAQRREAEEQQAEARQVFADYVGSIATVCPLLSDEDEVTRGRIGQMVAQDRARRGLSLALDEIAADAEQRLQAQARHKAGKIGLAGPAPAAAAPVAAASEPSAAESSQGNAQAPTKPRTLTASMAADSSTTRQTYPDGIEPIELRMQNAEAEARRLKRAAVDGS